MLLFIIFRFHHDINIRETPGPAYGDLTKKIENSVNSDKFYMLLFSVFGSHGDPNF